jgi:catechol-2,3-dioxygenase
MASPVKLAHVVYRTADHERMAKWYCDLLEAQVVFQNDFLAFIAYDEEHHRVAFAKTGANEQPGPQTRGVDHIAFTYANITDLLATWERLDRSEVRPFWCINHGTTTSIYYHDPDQNRVELQVDNMSMAEALAFGQSGAFRRNPIGIEFAPADLLRRHRAGETQESLVRWPDEALA